MTFYAETLLQISREQYPNDYLTQQIITAKKFIDSHFGDAIDLNQMADEAFYSKFHFIRCFKKLYGQTPYQYLTSVRVEKAKQLLQAEGSVADVCYNVGFTSVTSFTGLFKKMTGTTPAVYRNGREQLSRIETKNQFGDSQIKL